MTSKAPLVELDHTPRCLPSKQLVRFEGILDVQRREASTRSVHCQHRFGRGPRATRGLGEDKDHIRTFVEQRSFDNVDRQQPEHRQSDRGFSKCWSIAGACTFVSDNRRSLNR